MHKSCSRVFMMKFSEKCDEILVSPWYAILGNEIDQTYESVEFYIVVYFLCLCDSVTACVLCHQRGLKWVCVCLLISIHLLFLPSDFQWNQSDHILFVTRICLNLTSGAAWGWKGHWDSVCWSAENWILTCYDKWESVLINSQLLIAILEYYL